jgi:Fur family peroxide stress response transcriptional regulator
MERKVRTRETRQRRLVLKALRDTRSHPTAEWIFTRVREQLPNVSLGTVYRNLNVLREEGIVREIRSAGRSTRWDADLSPHGHFVCTACGEVRDVTDLRMHDWRSLKDLVGCEVTAQQTEFYGLCPVCLRRGSRRN